MTRMALGCALRALVIADCAVAIEPEESVTVTTCSPEFSMKGSLPGWMYRWEVMGNASAEEARAKAHRAPQTSLGEFMGRGPSRRAAPEKGDSDRRRTKPNSAGNSNAPRDYSIPRRRGRAASPACAARRAGRQASRRAPRIDSRAAERRSRRVEARR